MEKKVMSDYTLYCTKEQTRKAFELGAPIKAAAMPFYIALSIDKSRVPINKDDVLVLTPPTAEQMIGWLEEQEGIKEFFIYLIKTTWYYVIIKSNETVIERNDSYPSRKEATLAAIDAALEYLTNQKNK